jgi:hypothetical protein
MGICEREKVRAHIVFWEGSSEVLIRPGKDDYWLCGSLLSDDRDERPRHSCSALGGLRRSHPMLSLSVRYCLLGG